jgi:hypothetical protein
MNGLKVLITNRVLATRTGTEVYVHELATALLERNHTPIAYSTELGEIARDLRNYTVPVVDDLNAISTRPDIIHGHHNSETMTALLHFPRVPAVYFIHDNLAWHDVPPIFPRILRYIAVDHTCRDRLVCEYGIPEDRVRVFLNFVDLKKFKPRSPLPVHPRNAAVFSHHPDQLPAVREACASAGLTLDVIGEAGNNPSREPESLLGNYDIVFAKGRCALEALAVGAAVVLCDRAGLGPMVTSNQLNELRRFNFGHRTLSGPIEASLIRKEIDRYDAVDAGAVSSQIRLTAGIDLVVDELIKLYHDVIAEYSTLDGDGAAEAEGRAAAAFLRWQSGEFNSQNTMQRQRYADLYRKYEGRGLNGMRKRILNLPLFGRIARTANKRIKAPRQ